MSFREIEQKFKEAKELYGENIRIVTGREDGLYCAGSGNDESNSPNRQVGTIKQYSYVVLDSGQEPTFLSTGFLCRHHGMFGKCNHSNRKAFFCDRANIDNSDTFQERLLNLQGIEVD